jgi:protein gp37
MVFVNSMSDLFHEDVPVDFIARVWAIMNRAPAHTFQILTKRPERMCEWLNRAADWGGWITHNGNPPSAYDGDGIIIGSSDRWPLPNVWLGTSTENQEQADKRIPHLLRCPAAVRFVSAEPLLGAIDFRQWLPICDWCGEGEIMGNYRCSECGEFHCDGPQRTFSERIHQIIAGGESGPNARPCNVEWIRDIVRQCRAAGVACFVKQLGSRPYEPCRRCEGKGYHHGFGEHGHDPDWCTECGGSQAQFLDLRHPKGGAPSEWAEDLRVRQFPNEKAGQEDTPTGPAARQG